MFVQGQFVVEVRGDLGPIRVASLFLLPRSAVRIGPSIVVSCLSCLV